MVRRLISLPLFGIILILTGCAIADAPAYPGARELDAKASLGGAAGETARLGQTGTITSSSQTTLYALPKDTTFEDVRGYYADELEMLGYNESARVAMQTGEGTAQSVSYSSQDGRRTITVALINDPNVPNEKLISVSETTVSVS